MQPLWCIIDANIVLEAVRYKTMPVKRAEEYEGTFELMTLWRDETDSKERDETLADTQEAIDDGLECPIG